MAWKDFYFLAGGKVWIVGKLVIYGLPLLAMAFWPKRWGGPPDRDDFGYTTMTVMWVLFCIELAFAAASIFKVERQAHTLATLVVLPMSLQRIALHKILGVLPALLPTVAYATLGFLCAAPEILREIGSFKLTSSRDFAALMVFGYGFAQSVFFLYLTANLSLRVKRGALPLAIAIMFVLQFFLSIAFIATIRDEWAFAPLFCLTVFAILFLHHDTFGRLETLAAEE